MITTPVVPSDMSAGVGDIIEVTTTALTHGGDAVGRIGALVVFVAGAAPGERVRVRVTEARKRFLRARLVEVLDPSPDRVMPPCPYFGTCGGCQWQFLTYPGQLTAKSNILRDQLRRALRVPDAALDGMIGPIIGMHDPWAYRNSVSVIADTDGKPAYRHLHSHATVAVAHCPIAQPPINRALAALTQEGMTGVLTIRTDLDDSAVAFAPEERVATQHMLLGVPFRTDGAAFFQINTRQEAHPELHALMPEAWRHADADISMADLLAALVLRGMALTGHETVLDAYAGVGTFAWLAAPHARRVIAVEEVAAAATDARHNACVLGHENVIVYTRQVERLLPVLREPVDVAVLDPPRAGCAPAVLDALLTLVPRRIVYVSCDPATLARDLAILAARYEIASVQPVDMFPQTFHIESVTTLTRKEAA